MKRSVAYVDGSEDSRQELQSQLGTNLQVVDQADENTWTLIQGIPSEEALTAPHLRHVVIPYTGIPMRTRERLRGRTDLTVHNLHHHADETAEMAIALFLAVTKRVISADARLRQGDWSARHETAELPRLAGKTALVLGFGPIGQRIARACRGLRMEVVPLATRTRQQDGFEVGEITELAQRLPEADSLFIALPLTGETDGLLNRSMLKAVKHGAYVVNIARAAIVDERALFEALLARELGGAGLDVWYRYPKGDEIVRPSDLPFHTLDNVVLSPHRGGGSAESEAERTRHLARLIRVLDRGDWTVNRVDPDRGY